MKSTLYLLLALFGMLSAQAATSVFDDPRVVRWADIYLSDQRESVLESVEMDLRSEETSAACAPHIWVLLQVNQGMLDSAIKGLSEDPALSAGLGELPRVVQLYEAEAYQELLDAYPVDALAEIDDVWILYYLSQSARSVFRHDLQIEYCKRSLEVDGMFYVPVWSLLYMSKHTDFRKFEAIWAFANQPEIQSTPAGRVLQAGLRLYSADPEGRMDRVLSMDQYLESCPNDRFALRHIASAYEGLNCPEEAEASYQKALGAYPFGQNYSYSEVPKHMLRQERFAEAEAFVRRSVEIRPNAEIEDAELLFTIRWAEVLNDAGEGGKCRAVLDAGLAKWPDQMHLCERYARVEMTSRPREAPGWARKAYAADPERNRDLLLESLQAAGEDVELWRLHTEWALPVEQLNPRYMNELCEAALALEQPADAIPTVAGFLEVFPDSAWILRNFALVQWAAGQQKAALASLDKAITMNPTDYWTINKYDSWIEDREEIPELILEEIQSMRARYPWEEYWWEYEKTAIEACGDEVGVEFFEEMIAANPNRRWAYRQLLDYYWDAKEWEAAEAVLEREELAVAGSLADDIRNAAFDRAIPTILKLRVGQASRSELEANLVQWDVYASMYGGRISNFHYKYLAELYEALGQDKAAAEAQLITVQSYPDDARIAFNLIRNGHHSHIGAGVALGRLQRVVERNPYDEKGYKWIIESNTQWQGSVINALYWISVAKDKAPGAVNPTLESKARGQLGDYQSDYRNRYGSGRDAYSSFVSDRYIDWFESARSDAQEKSRKHIEIDYETRIARITHEDGSVVLRQDHPISGKVMLIQSGAAWMRAEYDSTGSWLTALRASSGEFVEMDYDADNNIIAMRRSEGSELVFQYNERGKPVEIRVVGRGALQVTYDEDGEVATVETDIEDDADTSHSVGMVVTEAMQALSSMAGRLNVGYDELPESLPFEDAVETELFDTMYEQWEADDPAWVPSQIALIHHLVENLEASYDRAEEAQALIDELFAEDVGFYSEDWDLLPKKEVFELLELQYELYRKARPDGLSADEWVDWNQVLAWAQLHVEATSEAAQFVAAVQGEPLVRLPLAAWLPSSDYSVPGFWRKFTPADYLPSAPEDAVVNVVYWRENGDVIAATNRGIAVFRVGYWEWFVFNASRKQWEPSDQPGRGEMNNVLSIAEGDDGRLWLGTADGLIRIDGDYGDPVTVWNTSHDGLPSNYIQALSAVEGGMAVGTLKGLVVFADEAEPKPLLAGENVLQLVAYPSIVEGWEDGLDLEELLDEEELAELGLGEEAAQSAIYWVRAERAVYRVEDDVTHLIYEGASESMAVDADGLELYLQIQGRVKVLALDVEGAQWASLPGEENILFSKETFGLYPITRPDDMPAMIIHSDQGLSFYSEFAVESMRLPYGDAEVEVYGLSSRDSSLVAHTSEGIYLFERENAITHLEGRVYDLLTADDLGLTLAAMGSRLDVVLHDSIDETETVDWVSARHLARAPDGGFYVAEISGEVHHYSKDLLDSDLLFEASPTQSPDGSWGRGPMRSMIVASDGAIWVAMGGSAFRWTESEGLKEYSYFLDSEAFPSLSQKIHSVVETQDGRVVAVASNEGHLSYRGAYLSGGQLIWNGERFVREEISKPTGWFLHTKTQVSENQAIYGTGNGFMRQTGDTMEHYRYELNDDPSHQAVVERAGGQTLLGTRGAKLGDDTWLFGCTGGVLGYQEGTWFYPDRLNWMLPEPSLSNYGSRVVHAVETDSQGRIYVGTDHGLMVYDSGGGDAFDFLVSNGQASMAFAQVEQNKMRRVGSALSELLLQAEEAQGNEWVARYRDSLSELSGLRSEVEQANAAKPGLAQAVDESSESSRDEIRARLRERELKHEALMLEIESAKATVANTLRVPPLQFEKWGQHLEEGQVAIQYVPAASRLTLNVISNQGIQNIVKVEVDREELYAAINRVVGSCHDEAKSRAIVFEDEEEAPATILAEVYDPTADLAWLYDQLIRPVERHLGSAEIVLIAASGKLNYLPFEALVAKTQPVPEYAVEKYVFGYLPSLYLYNAASNVERSDGNAEPLVVGNPTLDLDGAEAEALAVHQSLKTEVPALMREAATREAVLEAANDSSLIHLATHAKLDADTPQKSHIRLADGERLEVIDVLMMDLKSTDVVVLSCCESGLGAEGLEYMTLAYSFAHAGAPTTVATLWEVNDDSSQELMSRMYLYRMRGSDSFTALAEAKRSYLRKHEGDKRHPFYWSGYVGFGRP